MARLRTAAIVVTMMVLPHLAAADSKIRFEPPSRVAAAQTRYMRGKKLFKAQDYGAAATEFAAAYELDPKAKFLLYNLGVARRMSGDCRGAIDAYREFLDADPPEGTAKNARYGIEQCTPTTTPTTPPSSEPTEPEPVNPEPPPVEVRPPDTTTHIGERPDRSPPIKTTVPETAREPWYRDPAGDVLVGAGAACLVTGGALYLLARRDAAATATPDSFDDYQTNVASARRYQLASAITSAAGAGFVIAGAIRYATRPSSNKIAVAPTRTGAMVVLEGRF